MNIFGIYVGVNQIVALCLGVLSGLLLIYFLHLVVKNRSERRKYNCPITENQFNLAMNRISANEELSRTIDSNVVEKQPVVRKKWSKDELFIILYVVIYCDIDDNLIIGLEQLLDRSKSAIKTKIWRLNKISENFRKGNVSLLDYEMYYDVRGMRKSDRFGRLCKAVEDTGRGTGFINTHIL